MAINSQFSGINAIIFDLGGVILDIDYNKTIKAFQQLGIDDFEQMYSQLNASPLFQDLEMGKISQEAFCEALAHYVKQGGKNEIISAWNAMLLTYRRETINYIRKLREHYRLFLLSNTNAIHYEAFTKLYEQTIGGEPFNSLFERVYMSHQVFLRKPEREIYEYVLTDANLKAEETLFIDDSYQNITAANECGIRTVFLSKGMKVEDLGLI